MVFSGSSNPPLAQKIAELLHCPLASVELSKFSNEETRIWINEKKAPKTAIIVQSFSRPVDQHIVEFCLLADAVRRLGAADIIAVVPWLGYSKQDKVFRPGEPLSVKVVAKILQVVPIKQFITFDLHNLAILGFFDIPVTNLSARPLFEEYFKNKITPKTIVVAPDAGAIKASGAFASSLNMPIAYIDKSRDLSSGEVTVHGISRDVKGSNIVLVDDLIVTGSTLVESAIFLKNRGAKSISVAATHHLHLPGVSNALYAAGISSLVITDAVLPPEPLTHTIILSVANLIADLLQRTL